MNASKTEKIVVAVTLLLCIALVVNAFRYKPRAEDFAHVREEVGLLIYSGAQRNTLVTLNLKPVYTDVTAFGGLSTPVIGSAPNHAIVIATIASIRTMFGSSPMIVEIKSEQGGKVYLQRTADDCIAVWVSRTITYSSIYCVILTMAGAIVLALLPRKRGICGA